MTAMGLPAPVELAARCAHCLLDGGAVETFDPLVAACRFGVAARVACPLCGAVSEGAIDRPLARAITEVAANACPSCGVLLGPSAVDIHGCAHCGVRASLELRAPPAIPRSAVDLEDALERWARSSGFSSRCELMVATFASTDEASLLAKLHGGEPIDTLIDPFATLGHRVTASSTSLPDLDDDDDHDAEREPSPPSAPPRAILYPLVSVISADGEIHPNERSLLDRFLASEGLAPLADGELRFHDPAVVARLVPAHRREAVIQLMCESACADGMPDESERRVIRAYAKAWGVADDKVEFWMWAHESIGTSIARQLWLKIRRFVLSARWESTS